MEYNGKQLRRSERIRNRNLRRSEHIQNRNLKQSKIEKKNDLLLPPKISFKKSRKKKVVSKHHFGEATLFTVQNTESVNKDKINWTEWVSATQTKNYLLDDGFLDVLAYKSSNIIKADPRYEQDIGKMIKMSTNGKGFVPSVMTSGNVFESKVIHLMKNELGEKNVLDIGGNKNPRSLKKYEETIKAIKKGVPVIFQGILRNYENKTYGIPDILIRSDWINRFTDVNSLTSEEVHISAPKLGKNYHYIVIDIKYKILMLRSDGIHLRNDGSLKAYKSQLWIYNDALSKIQGYSAPYAFILGSKFKYTCSNEDYEGNTCFDRLGKIDYENLDNIYVQKTQDAVNWLKDVRENNYDLTKYPLERDELYPNMCNRFDYPYHGIKKTFAEANKDLTLLWNVGPKQRRFANENGVYTWSDPNCTPETLGVNGKKRSRVLSRILEANHGEGKNIYPKYIEKNYGDWKNTEGRRLELFVDFETTCSILNDLEELPYNTNESLIFLIGAGYIDPKTKKWIYESFIVNKIDEFEERRICLDFVNFINELAEKFQIREDIVLWHYSHAEVSSWRRFEERFGKSYDLCWVDLLKVFLEEPIGIKGALNYSLKTISKTFHSHGYIKTIWSEGEVTNGADAALGAYKANLECIKTGTSFSKHDLVKEIVKYNEVDCHVLQEILFYLRENHIDYEIEEENPKRKRLKY